MNIRRLLAWNYLLVSVNLAVGAEALPQLKKSQESLEQQIPLIGIQTSQAQKAICVRLQLTWNRPPSSESGVSVSEPVFQLEEGIDPRAGDMILSQLWIAGLASAMAWQEPWENPRWKIGKFPSIESSGISAGLGVGLMATAAGIPFPQDTVIIGGLNPDRSLGKVSQVLKRIQAADRVGLRRVVLPNSARFDVSASGVITNVETFAKDLGIECIFVADLTEAAEKVLRCKLPSAPNINAVPHYIGPLFKYLEGKCKIELSRIELSRKKWPQAGDLNKFRRFEQDAWRQVFHDYEVGVDAYRSGQLYIARDRLNRANGNLRAISAVKRTNSDPYKEQNRAQALRKQLLEPLIKSAEECNELQTALLLSEQSDWLYEVTSKLEGAEILAKQAFGVRSDATPQQKQNAEDVLIGALADAEYHIANDLNFYSGLASAINLQKPIFVSKGAALWLSQLLPTHLALAEGFSRELSRNANRYLEYLIFDSRLATQARVLREAKLVWERRDEEVPITKKDDLQKVGFVPGPAFAPPQSPFIPPPSPKGSELTRCLTWVNDFCEVSFLEHKYLRLSGTMNRVTQQWETRDHAVLQTMLQNADLEARRGMIFAEKAGIDSSVFLLIYERASNLRALDDEKYKLEALRQYWRCSLLGNMCWQLGSTADPIPSAIPTLTTKIVPTKVKEPNEVKPKPAAVSVKPAAPSIRAQGVVLKKAVKNTPTPAPAKEPAVLPPKPEKTKEPTSKSQILSVSTSTGDPFLSVTETKRPKAMRAMPIEEKPKKELWDTSID
jgi:hypothetical protein